MINNLTLVGRVGKEPEIRYFQSGAAVASFPVAVNRPTKEKETDWFDVKVWGKQVETIQKFVQKGHLIGIIGRLEQERWEQNGEKRSKVVINANQIRLMQPKEGSSKNPNGDTVDDIFGSDDEIPF